MCNLYCIIIVGIFRWDLLHGLLTLSLPIAICLSHARKTQARMLLDKEDLDDLTLKFGRSMVRRESQKREGQLDQYVEMRQYKKDPKSVRLFGCSVVCTH
jgi:hypothetical protein